MEAPVLFWAPFHFSALNLLIFHPHCPDLIQRLRARDDDVVMASAGLLVDRLDAAIAAFPSTLQIIAPGLSTCVRADADLEFRMNIGREIGWLERCR